jgi:Leucine-rich repeat (LRR) protein
VSSNDHKLVQCNEKDQETLLIFKKGINDSSNGKISTWLTKKDCCAWEGIHCDSKTGRVTELDLSYQFLKGEINFSILELEFMSYLDLSYNNFDLINISATQHNMTHKKSNLFYLDLSFGTLHMDNLEWLSLLSSLKYLNLTGIDLQKETNWLQAVKSLPSLLELHLRFCNLNDFIINPSVKFLNLSSLLTLDLSGNNFTFKLPSQFFNLTKDLTILHLRLNNIHGEIPTSLLNLQNLRYLDLAQNQLQGSIPYGIGQLANIQHLNLEYNLLSGSVPSTVRNLSSLYALSIGHNNFSGEISENTFSKLSNLYYLDLSYSNLVFQFDLDWIPPFQLNYLSLGNTNQGPKFPSWIMDIYTKVNGISRLIELRNFIGR